MRTKIAKRFSFLVAVFLVVMTLVAVQSVWAEEMTVTGTIERLGSGSIDVAANGTIYTFYDIPFADLATQGIYLDTGDVVTVSAYVVIFPKGTSKYIAYSITAEAVTYTWHPNIPKTGSGKSAVSASATAATDCICDKCYCNCPEDCIDCACDCLCDCACDGTGLKGSKK
jgi:hypothetical protein